jgi:RNA polymerase-binding protein DksA
MARTRAPRAPAKGSTARSDKASAVTTTVAKSPARKSPAAKGAAAKTPAVEPPEVRAPAVKAPAVKGPAVKAPAKNTPAKKTPTARRPTAKAPPRTSTPAATEKGTRKTKNVVDKATAQDLAVKPDEDPWTTEELAEVRGELHADRERLRRQLNLAEHELQDLMRDAGDGAGHDQADVGSTTFERDQEMSLAKNAREMLAQTERALLRIEDGSYGRCESCGQPIGKMRVMAFPRATLCLSCKQREERR